MVMVMAQDKLIPVVYRDKRAHLSDIAAYRAMHARSLAEPQKFWGEMAERLTWYRQWDEVSRGGFGAADVEWYRGGELNACYNCLDRHVEAGRGDTTALVWEGNEPSVSASFTYHELLTEVKRCAAALKNYGVKKGDRVCIYLQMIPQLAIAVLACARLGAVHTVVFGAFSAQALRERINDADCKLLITQDTGVRGVRDDIAMKANADLALQDCPQVEKVIVVKHTGKEVSFNSSRDVWWHAAETQGEADCAVMAAEDPLFILYTSGSTGRPKGVLHTTGGYLVYVACTHKYVFDYQDGDIYWCAADIGWITGHSYIIYAPLANGATTVMFEGVPHYPDFGRWWQIIAKHKVNIFYTAPTALRALMREGDSWVRQHDLSSLKLLGTVGEPIKETEWLWYYRMIGKEQCPIVDTWWQTETGGIMIAPLPAATPLKAGSATLPFFGIEPAILNEQGNEMEGNPATGYLVIKKPWPSMARTIYGDHERFRATYLRRFAGYYFTGDGASRDAQGYYCISGRTDDVLNISGHRLGTAEIEGAIGKHQHVAEAAVVGYPHEIKGEAICAYVVLRRGATSSPALGEEIKQTVRNCIGAIAIPDRIHFANALPKTRSGKIMRRILRKIATDDTNDLGDTSTLADPQVVTELLLDEGS